MPRWYHLQVKVAVPVENIVELNAVFEDATIQEVLRNITAALNLEYRRDRKQVTFYRQQRAQIFPTRFIRLRVRIAYTAFT